MNLNRNYHKNQILRALRKHIFAMLLSFSLLLPLLFSVGLTGSCYTVTLSSEKEVRPGQSFTVRLRLDESAYGYQGVVVYDSSVLTMTNVKPVNNGEDILDEFHVYADTGLVVVTHKDPVKNMLNITFRVSDDAKIGSSTSIHVHSGEVLNGENREAANDVSFIVKFVNKKSSDAALSSLAMKVLDAEGQELSVDLSPSFSGKTTFYKADNVPDSYVRYQFSARTADSSAKIDSALEGSLEEGWNEVSISVRAEDGTLEKYTVMIFREYREEVSQVVSEETPSEQEPSSEEPVSSEDAASEEESSEDQTSEESDPSEADPSVEPSEGPSEENSPDNSEESSVVSEESSSASSSIAPIVPYHPETHDWTGIIFGIAAGGAIAIVALLIRILFIYRKKQKA